MTTRRSLLRLAGGATAATVLGGCTSRADPAPPERRAAELLFVSTAAGLTVLRADSGKPTLTSPAMLATPDWTRLVGVRPEGTGTRVVTLDARSGQILSGARLPGRLEPRVVSPDGRLVALATPGLRERTTIVVADSGGERTRLDLPGNLEPEAFSNGGNLLFVLDHLPPARPDRYRVRMIDLRAGTLRPLLTRLKAPVPAEEEMRGQGRQAVYDPRRSVLFTLYTHQPDHLHARDLISGARAGAPAVHAFVHCLHLGEAWAYCIDLPEPFGTGDPTGYALTRAAAAGRLAVVDAAVGLVADLHADSLTVERVHRFADPGLTGEACALSTTAEELVVAAGRTVVASSTKRRIDLPGPARGLAAGSSTTVWVGQDGAAVRYDLATGQESQRVPVPDLVRLRHVAPVA